MTRKFTEQLEYIKRYRTILKVLLKYGFGHLVEKLNIEHYFEYGRKIFYKNNKSQVKIKLKNSERLRMAFEELGPTFIKFGQILSSRPDLISQDYIVELKKLQDKVEPIPFEVIKNIIEKNFDNDIEDIFKYIDTNPIGAASIAQVHRAVLKNGEEVVLKVKKPFIEHIIEVDIEILFDIARLIERRIPDLALYNPVNIVEEFSKAIKKELDFTREGRNNDIVRLNFENFKNFRVPKIYWDYTNKNIITMELIKGEKLSKLLETGYSSKELAKLGIDIYFKQIFEDGFFHADPHPGNIFVEKNNRALVFIDYGMVGTFDEKEQENMAEIMLGLSLKDINKVINGFRGFNIFPDGINEKSLKAELKEILDKYYTTLNKINIGEVFDEMSNVIVRYKVKIPSELFIIGKTIMTMEGIARQLDPNFDIATEIRPFAEKLIMRKYSLKKILKNINDDLIIYKNFFENIPQDMQEIIKKLKDNKFFIEVKSRELNDFNKIVDRVTNRVTAAIIVASLIIASANLISSQTGIMIKGYSVLGIAGFIIAGIFSVIILIDIIRKG